MRGKFVLAPNGDQLVPSCLSHFWESVQRGLTVLCIRHTVTIQLLKVESMHPQEC